MKIKEFIIMPHTADSMGLIHRPGTGPNNRYDFKNKGNNRANEQQDEKINYKPTIDTDEEWKEAGYIDPKTKQPRYPQLAKLGPAGFTALVNRGRNKKVTRPENIKNTTATSVQQAKQEFSRLEPDKRMRFQQALQTGQIERPIVVRFGPGDTNDVLIGGNTRFTGLMAMGIQPEVKFIDLSNQQVEDAAGVGIITKQNTTKDVKPGDEYKNVKKLHLEYKEFLENFADGKKKGKSRPGRVKRAGASCKGSVSSLRSKAKKYGGEKGKMYHWCANMKSGRKKK